MTVFGEKIELKYANKPPDKPTQLLQLNLSNSVAAVFLPPVKQAYKEGEAFQVGGGEGVPYRVPVEGRGTMLVSDKGEGGDKEAR
ncbi:MAG: hypothetical protein QXS27_01295 [Candidatus Jordarchaeaceae archaeon]